LELVTLEKIVEVIAEKLESDALCVSYEMVSE
jgi:hypothetical protein